MGRRLQLPAAQLVGLALLGSLILASAFVLTPPVDKWSHVFSKGWVVAILLLLCAGAAVLMLKAEFDFRNGIQNGIWSDEELAPLRAIFTSGWLTAVAIAGVIGFIVIMFAASRSYHGVGWAIFLLNQSLMRLQMAFRRKTPDNPTPPTWSGLSLIQSEHWGEH